MAMARKVSLRSYAYFVSFALMTLLQHFLLKEYDERVRDDADDVAPEISGFFFNYGYT